MKTRILLILLMLLSFVFSKAQVTDVNSDGIRIVASKSRPVYASVWKSGNEQRYSPYLSVHHSNDSLHREWNICMRISSNLPLRVDKGAKLLMLLGNGEVVELSSSNEACDRIGDIRSTGISPRDYAKVYEISVIYPVELTDIQRIIELGVSKMRIEFVDNLHDEVYSNAKFTNAVRDGYAEVADHLKRHPGSANGMRDVYEGFAGASQKTSGIYNFTKAKASGRYYTRSKNGVKFYYDPDSKSYITRDEFLKKYEEWELEKLEKLDE